MEKLDLKSLIKQYPGCMESRAKLRSTLTDCYPQPEHKREINLALIVYESGLLTKIREKDSLAPHETAAMCAKIENEYGIPPELSVRAIVAWGEVWGTSVSAAITQAPNPAPVVTEPAPQPAPKPITPVQGSVSEYVIEERKEGWFITKFQGFEQEDMIIPNIIDGKLIVGLEGGVFKGCKGIKKVTISEGIRFLRERNKTARYASDKKGVFQACSVEQVQLPNTLEEIGGSCFNSSDLKSIVIPNGVTHIGKGAFESCKFLNHISIGNSVIGIEADAFRDCKNLTEISIPSSVTDIGACAFYNCSGLQKVVLPKYLKEIRAYTFSKCGKLSNISTPEELRSIGQGAFSMCGELQKICIPASVTSIVYGIRHEKLNNRGGERIIIDDSFGYSGLNTIYCTPGSAAMEYARKKGIKCLPL